MALASGLASEQVLLGSSRCRGTYWYTPCMPPDMLTCRPLGSSKGLWPARHCSTWAGPAWEEQVSAWVSAGLVSVVRHNNRLHTPGSYRTLTFRRRARCHNCRLLRRTRRCTRPSTRPPGGSTKHGTSGRTRMELAGCRSTASPGRRWCHRRCGNRSPRGHCCSRNICRCKSRVLHYPSMFYCSSTRNVLDEVVLRDTDRPRMHLMLLRLGRTGRLRLPGGITGGSPGTG